jgi:hypothetical protein
MSVLLASLARLCQNVVRAIQVAPIGDQTHADPADRAPEAFPVSHDAMMIAQVVAAVAVLTVMIVPRVVTVIPAQVVAAAVVVAVLIAIPVQVAAAVVVVVLIVMIVRLAAIVIPVQVVVAVLIVIPAQVVAATVMTALVLIVIPVQVVAAVVVAVLIVMIVRLVATVMTVEVVGVLTVMIVRLAVTVMTVEVVGVLTVMIVRLAVIAMIGLVGLGAMIVSQKDRVRMMTVKVGVVLTVMIAHLVVTEMTVEAVGVLTATIVVLALLALLLKNALKKLNGVQVVVAPLVRCQHLQSALVKSGSMRVPLVPFDARKVFVLAEQVVHKRVDAKKYARSTQLLKNSRKRLAVVDHHVPSSVTKQHCRRLKHTDTKMLAKF